MPGNLRKACINRNLNPTSRLCSTLFAMATIDEEISQRKKLINLVTDVRKKYVELSTLRAENYNQIRENFQPPTDTMEKLHKNVSHSEAKSSHVSPPPPTPIHTSAVNIADSKLPPLNNPNFGLKYDSDKKRFFIANHPVIVGGHVLTLKGIDYLGTPGLENLFTCRKAPSPGTYTKEDLSAYREILRSVRENLFEKSSGIPSRGKKASFIKRIMKNRKIMTKTVIMITPSSNLRIKRLNQVEECTRSQSQKEKSI